MTEIKVKYDLVKTVSIVEQVLGSRLYWLHNRVGNRDWEVKIVQGETVVKVKDAKMLTYLLLKLK